ncbi:MAG TPA: Ig-like domain-containing protein, partial [Bacteroidota bacterium]|nr:Ig-like domain-containing protein [Bacteroidota bacterium]
STITDVNGNHLAPYTFSYTPEPYFRITATSPPNDTLAPSDLVRIYFNGEINASFINSLHGIAGPSAHWFIPATTGYEADCNESMQANESVVITVDTGATDIYGHALSRPYSFTVYAAPFQVINTPVFGKLSSMGGLNMLSQRFGLTFNYPPDTSTIMPAISVSPSTPLLYIGKSDTLYATNDFLPNTKYTITFSTTLRDSDGATLPTPEMYDFQTSPFLISTWGGDENGITIFFDGRIDTASFREAFSLSPPVAGTFAFNYSSRNGEVSAYFNAPLGRHVTYTFVVSTALKSISGFHLAQADTGSFSTL